MSKALQTQRRQCDGTDRERVEPERFLTPPTQHQSTSPSTATTPSKHNGESKIPALRRFHACTNRSVVHNRTGGHGYWMDSSGLLWMTPDNRLTDLGPSFQSESNFTRFVEVGRGMHRLTPHLGDSEYTIYFCAGFLSCPPPIWTACWQNCRYR